MWDSSGGSRNSTYYIGQSGQQDDKDKKGRRGRKGATIKVKFDKVGKRGPEWVGRIKNEEIVASEWFTTRTRCLLRANHDVVANSDKELGQTHMVKMRIDTGDQTLIKLKPYRTPIHKRPLVEEPVQGKGRDDQAIWVTLELSHIGSG